jgi:hypothetical protein
VRSAFVSTAATHGLSIELVQVAGATDEPAEAQPAGNDVSGEPEKLLDLTPDEWSDID